MEKHQRSAFLDCSFSALGRCIQDFPESDGNSIFTLFVKSGFEEELKIESTEPCVWYSLDLLNTLLRLSQTNMYNDVRQMLTSPLKVYPEVLLCGLALVDVIFTFSMLSDILQKC